MPAPLLYTQDAAGQFERRFLVVWPIKMYTVQMLIKAKKFVQAILALIMAKKQLKFIHDECNYIQGGISLDSIVICDAP